MPLQSEDLFCRSTRVNSSRVSFEDLKFILQALPRQAWEDLRGQRIFITGGTGFFGCWLLESLTAANDAFDLRISATVLTRRPEMFARKAPHLASHPSIELLPGDIRTFKFPSREYRYLIHAATEASLQQILDGPLEMLSTIVDGTRRVLEFAHSAKVQKLLLTSSGAVYGRQPAAITHVHEEFAGAPDPLNPRSVYGQSKRTAEQLCSIYATRYGIECKIARCFAFVGPHLPLDTHFAIGNFLRDAMTENSIQVSGDGTPRRSYLYAADLAVWLWTILLNGRSLYPYNVGSENDYSIGQIATAVSEAMPVGDGSTVPVQICKPRREFSEDPPERYVPSTQRARAELGLQESFDLRESVRRTAEWCGWRQPAAIRDRKTLCA
jgi:nucleoside-diphosphate-sugar epimerase